MTRKDEPSRYEVRDPIHGFVQLSEREMAVVNCQAFQRLRRIRQLALATLVYPGAGHTRFEHSLGTLHIAGIIAEQLQETNAASQEGVIVVRLAALLHDLGHGPFSHVSEHLLGRYSKTNDFRTDAGEESVHEHLSAQLVASDPHIQKALGKTLGQGVSAVLTGAQAAGVLRDVISGPLDADKLDYILRDAYFAGVKYGSFDLPKILESMMVVGSGASARLGIHWEGIHAVEQLVVAKHHMTVQVYRHRIRAITDAMIVRGLELAIDGGDEQMAKLYHYDDTEGHLRLYLEWWDDRVVEHMLECQVPAARAIYQRLLARKLFKEIHRRAINAREMPDLRLRSRFLALAREECRSLEASIAKLQSLNTHADHVIVNVVSVANPTYRPPAARITEDEIQVQLKDGSVKYLKEIESSILSLPNVEEKQQYVEVYAPGDRWSNLAGSKRSNFLARLDRQVGEVLYN